MVKFFDLLFSFLGLGLICDYRGRGRKRSGGRREGGGGMRDRGKGRR